MSHNKGKCVECEKNNFLEVVEILNYYLPEELSTKIAQSTHENEKCYYCKNMMCKNHTYLNSEVIGNFGVDFYKCCKCCQEEWYF